MFKKYIWVAVVFVAVLAVMLAFTPASEWALTGAIFGVMMLAVVAIQVVAARRFILRHPRSTIAVGVGAVGVSMFVLFSTLSSPSVDPELGGTAFTFLILVGSLVVALPLMAKRVEKDTAIWKATEAAAKSMSGTFNPEFEVKAIFAEMIAHRGSLLRVVGPWFLIFCLLPLVFIDLDFWKGLADRDRGTAMMILLGLLVVILAEMAFLFVAMIKWIQFVATKQEPRLIDFPGRALWGWVWRWFLFGSVFRALDGLEPWLKAQLPSAAQWQLDGVQSLLGLVVLVLFSPFALVLPAVALNAADKGMAASMQGFRLVGRKYYLAAGLILTPYALVSWGLDILYDHYKGPIAAVANFGASMILVFATMIVGMTYLTRIYLRGETAAASAA